MKILFVSSGNGKNNTISPIVKNQGNSLEKEGIRVEYFPIKGKGIKGYLRAVFTLRDKLKDNRYDVIHAHYWISGIVASFSGAKPLVVSLMGDDVKAKVWFKWIIYIFYSLSWKKTIVKSEDMYISFGKKDVAIVPNGVNMDRFKPIYKKEALKITRWNRDKKHILFTSNPQRVEKNFKLVEDAIKYINNPNVELHSLFDVPNRLVPYYYNSADVIVLSSLWEGSPNAIKESMACNIPIVSTDVGDVKDVIKKSKGCYISSFDYKDFGEKIEKALNFNRRTTGREDIAHLKEEIIAKRLIDIYIDIKDKK